MEVCKAAGVRCETSRIRKPLLALALIGVGFTPVLPGKGVVEVEISKGVDGEVEVYTEDYGLKLEFGETEVTSQRIRLVGVKGGGGRRVWIRAKYQLKGEGGGGEGEGVKWGEEGGGLTKDMAVDIVTGRL